eukprot:659278_1
MGFLSDSNTEGEGSLLRDFETWLDENVTDVDLMEEERDDPENSIFLEYLYYEVDPKKKYPGVNDFANTFVKVIPRGPTPDKSGLDAIGRSMFGPSPQDNKFLISGYIREFSNSNSLNV